MYGCLLLTVSASRAGWSKDLTRVRLYKPSIIATYMAVFGLPVALFLYGLNVFHRGERSVGVLICSVSAMSYTVLLAGRMVAAGVEIMSYPGVFAALALFQLEAPSYHAAGQMGARPAKWWPPLVVVLGIALAAVFIRIAFLESRD